MPPRPIIVECPKCHTRNRNRLWCSQCGWNYDDPLANLLSNSPFNKKRKGRSYEQVNKGN